jgi:DNA-binding XRE family transcriptional regulator
VKFTDRLAQSAQRPAKREPGQAMRERAQARAERERGLEERNRRNRERYLSPVDQALAASLRIPRTLDARRALAVRLREGTNGQRTYNEVGALMGVSHVTVHYYLNDPGYEGRSTRYYRERRIAERLGLPPPERPKPIGERIRGWREEAGWSVARLAEEIGVPPGRVTAWEEKRAWPKPKQLAQIKRVLGG